MLYYLLLTRPLLVSVFNQFWPNCKSPKHTLDPPIEDGVLALSLADSVGLVAYSLGLIKIGNISLCFMTEVTMKISLKTFVAVNVAFRLGAVAISSIIPRRQPGKPYWKKLCHLPALTKMPLKLPSLLYFHLMFCGSLHSKTCLAARKGASLASDVLPLADLNLFLEKVCPKINHRPHEILWTFYGSHHASCSPTSQLPSYYSLLCPFCKPRHFLCYLTLPVQYIHGKSLNISFSFTFGSDHTLIGVLIAQAAQTFPSSHLRILSSVEINLSSRLSWILGLQLLVDNTCASFSLTRDIFRLFTLSPSIFVRDVSFLARLLNPCLHVWSISVSRTKLMLIATFTTMILLLSSR